MKKNGILVEAKKFDFFGVRVLWLGIIWHAIKERRMAELLISAWWMVLYQIKKPAEPPEKTQLNEFSLRFTRFNLPDGISLLARQCGICRWGANNIVACEYGEPGARILLVQDGAASVSCPYAQNRRVWHIHAIAHLGGNQYLVSTGDSAKLLDVVSIGPHGSEILKRLVSHCGGYTSMLRCCGETWVGSDLSERANFIATIPDRGKYFLPPQSTKEYVIHLQSIPNDQLLVITRRLHTRNGHALKFCTKTRRFVAENEISIREEINEESIFH
jgi:hypothetical protein